MKTNRRTFLQNLLAVIPLLPAKTLYADIGKAINHPDIWLEEPETAQELYDSVNKYCINVSSCNTAYARKLDKAVIPELFRLRSEAVNAEKRCVRTIWNALRVRIVKFDNPSVFWRRAPIAEIDNNLDAMNNVTYVSTRVAIYES